LQAAFDLLIDTQNELQAAFNLLDTLQQLPTLPPAQPSPPPTQNWWNHLYHHGISDEYIKQDFIKNAREILSFMGAYDVVVNEESIQLTAYYLVAEVELIIAYPYCSGFAQVVQVVLNYYVLRSGIEWRVRVYKFCSFDREECLMCFHTIRQPAFAERIDGQPFELEGYITVTFSTYDWTATGWENIWGSVDVQIYAANWQEEFIRLFRYHTGLRLRDIWYEGNMIVADFYSATSSAFIFIGSYPEGIMYRLMFPPLFSLPYVEVVDFLIDGRRAQFGHGNVFCSPLGLPDVGRLCPGCPDEWFW